MQHPVLPGSPQVLPDRQSMARLQTAVPAVHPHYRAAPPEDRVQIQER
jgi:hypothetical protein